MSLQMQVNDRMQVSGVPVGIYSVSIRGQVHQLICALN